MSAKKWNIETLTEDAKKYSTRGEWARCSVGAYTTAHKLKLLDIVCAHMPPGYRKWTKEEALGESLRFASRGEWAIKSPKSYMAARKKGWLKDCALSRTGGTSGPEKELFCVLLCQYPKLINNARFGSRRPGKYGQYFELDVFCPDTNRGIEFNGSYFHSPKGILRAKRGWPPSMALRYHDIKRNFFNALKIQYLEVDELEWYNNKQAIITRCIDFLRKNG